MKSIRRIIQSVVVAALPLLGGVGGGLLTSCNDSLDIVPENALPTENVWRTKAYVESVLLSGYYEMRSAIKTHLIPLGELRAGCVRSVGSSNLDRLEIKSTDSFTNWQIFYCMVNSANAVLQNAEIVRKKDATYTQQELNSDLCEAYFLRALAYFYIARNWGDAPLVLQPYETDENDFYPAKVSQTILLEQIKKDLEAAVNLGAAKEAYDAKWETKGRCTIWSIYALLTDVCLWKSDFNDAVTYANRILESKSANAPTFITTASHEGWFAIFNPGNSQESILELQYSKNMMEGTTFQKNDLPTTFYPVGESTNASYRLSQNFYRLMDKDEQYIQGLYFDPEYSTRYNYGGYAGTLTAPYIWKYTGGTTREQVRTASNYDPNFIIYRVTDVMLMKAEALLMREYGENSNDNQAAIDIINTTRARTNLTTITTAATAGLFDLMNQLLLERLKEFCGEGKTWYDLLRIGSYNDPTGSINFAKDFLIETVALYNEVAKPSKVRSVLLDKNAWYLPIYETELDRNDNLVQNAFYD